MKRVLVDTNVVIWMLAGNRKRVSKAAATVLEDDRVQIFVSAVTVWEIATKRSLGKLKAPADWARSLNVIGLEPLPITALHAEAVEHLPWHHRDPFDRFLVAQAGVEGMALVSADSQMNAYDVDLIW